MLLNFNLQWKRFATFSILLMWGEMYLDQVALALVFPMLALKNILLSLCLFLKV